MSDTVLYLLIVQSILLIGVLFVLLTLLNRLSATGDRVDKLISDVDRLVSQDVKAAVSEARQAIEKVDLVTGGVAQSLVTAEPVIKAVSGIAQIFEKPSAPIWMDAVRLGVRLFSAAKSGKQASAKQESLPADVSAEEDEDVERVG